MAGAPAWRTMADGLALAVRVTPKSSRDAVEGLEVRGPATVLKVRVRAAPEDGKANAAVTALIEAWLALPRRQVALTAGHASREKTVSLRGDPVQLAHLLTAKLGDLDR